MACKLPHTAEDFQRCIKAQTENCDADRHNAIVEIIRKFELTKKLNRKLREHYERCTDISDDRKSVIYSFLDDEYRKEAAMVEPLWACLYQLEAQIDNKIRWSFEENVESDKIEQQLKQQGVSSSSAPRDVLQQPQLPDLNLPQPSYEENVEANNGG